MAALFTDLRFACRSLMKARGFTATALFTLALGMALFLTATIVTRAYLLRGLPYPAAERLHWLRYDAPGLPQPRELERLDWAALADVIEHPIAWDLDVFYMLGGDHAEALSGTWVTPDFVDALGIQPALGRGIATEAFEPGGVNEVLISHGLWQSRFGGAPDVLGRSFPAYVSDRPSETERFTIVGVLPADFWHMNPYTEVLAPLRASTYPYMARLRPGVSPAVVQERVTALVAAGAPDVPQGWSARVVPVHESYVASIRPTLRAVLIAGTLVLLVACANVAALLLVRGNQRRKEVSIRAALGAGRGAIARLLATEAMVLGLLASGLALLITSFSLDGLAPILQQQIGRPAPGGAAAFAIDWQLAAFAVAAGLATAVACSLAPLVALVRPRVLAALEGRSRTSTEGRGASRFRSALIALEIAASLALLAGATLMLRSAHGLGRVDLGISSERVLTGSTALRHSRYPDAPSRIAVFDELQTRLAAIPGTEAVAFTRIWPLQQPRLQVVQTAGGEHQTRAPIQVVSPAYFQVLGIPMRSGRAFSDADRDGAEHVAIVSETLARRLWPDRDPLGSTLMAPPRGGTTPLPRIVVGVAADVRQGAADDEQADVYMPLWQEPGRFAFALLRTSGPPEHAIAPFRAAFRDVDPEIAIDPVRPMQATVDPTVAGSRFLAMLLAGFALAAAALALVGVYGAIAYTVRQREREIAIRVAIGADPSRIVRLFVRQGGVILLAGLALGAGGALAGGRVIESQLYGVTPGDPLALAAAALAFGAAALLATWWPARRAAATDPAIALRAE